MPYMKSYLQKRYRAKLAQTFGQVSDSSQTPENRV